MTETWLEKVQAYFWSAGLRVESINVLKVFREQYLGIQMETLLDFALQYSSNEIVAAFKALVVSLKRKSGTYLTVLQAYCRAFLSL